jgi:hypothetical protein
MLLVVAVNTWLSSARARHPPWEEAAIKINCFVIPIEKRERGSIPCLWGASRVLV